MARRRRKRKAYGDDARSPAEKANDAYRRATVHLEEAVYHAQKGNCDEAVKRLSEGSRQLGAGQAFDWKMGQESDMGSFRTKAEYEVRKRCLR